jgi:hypothetical protein
MADRMAIASRTSALIQRTFDGDPLAGPRTATTRTSWPSATRTSTRLVPTCPAPLVTSASRSYHRSAPLDIEPVPLSVRTLEEGLTTSERDAGQSRDDPTVGIDCRAGGPVVDDPEYGPT